LWPTAFEVVRLKLQPFLPGDVEDVAMEVMEDLVEKVRQIKQVQELKPLTASIAHNRAVSRLRRHFSDKRGRGQTQSLEAQTQDDGDCPQPSMTASPLEALEEKELAERLQRALVALKPPLGEVLADFFLRSLSYEEIAKKRGIAVGSVGVFLKRGLEAIRRTWSCNGK